MLGKWERQPGRVGMLAGFIALPLLALLQDALLHFIFDRSALFRFDILQYLVRSATPGAILGAGASQAVFAWRQGNSGRAKQHLIRYGAILSLVITLITGSVVRTVWTHISNPSAKTFWLGHQIPGWATVPVTFVTIGGLPLQIALLMLFIGLFMRSNSSKTV